jgi:membrane protease YdiL (CAAX protease family)
MATSVLGLVPFLLLGGDADAEGVGVTVVTLAASWVGLVGVTLWASRRKGRGDLDRDFGFRLEGRDVPKGVVVGLACYFILVPLIVLLVETLFHDVNVSQQSEELTADASGWSMALLGPFLVVGAPLVEELFFRGLLQRSLVRRLGVMPGIVIGGFLFGLAHGMVDIDGWTVVALVLALSAFGMVLGTLAHRTGRLGPGMVAHGVFNLITVLILA